MLYSNVNKQCMYFFKFYTFIRKLQIEYSSTDSVMVHEIQTVCTCFQLIDIVISREIILLYKFFIYMFNCNIVYAGYKICRPSPWMFDE